MDLLPVRAVPCFCCLYLSKFFSVCLHHLLKRDKILYPHRQEVGKQDCRDMQKHWKLSTQPGIPRKVDHTAYGIVISMWKLNQSYVFRSSQERFSQGPFISDNLFTYMKTHQDTTCSVQYRQWQRQDINIKLWMAHKIK